MEMFFHTKWWDYSTYPCNLNGRICFKNSTLFGIMVLFVYYILHPGVVDIISFIPNHFQIAISVLFSGIFLYDGLNTLRALLRKNKDFTEIENSIKELTKEFKNAQIFPLEEPLSVRVKQILDATDADEVILSHIKKVYDMVDSLHQKRSHTHNRLSKAIPNRKEALSRVGVENLFKTVHDYLRRNHS